MDKKDARKMARFTQFAVAAASQAMKDAGLSKENIDANRTGIILGNGIGGFEIYQEAFKNTFKLLGSYSADDCSPSYSE